MAEEAPPDAVEAPPTGTFIFPDGAKYEGEWKPRDPVEGEEVKEPAEGEEPIRNFMRHGRD